ncbi:hypothetical protein O6H91_06G012500 [Diphasiastrum complanatum]|uniref:Uncharacterized protein n=1 Tax=Diphasiastrum complanatum TaxID=34168 RepID=A0ACC2DB88_DIPCM|nr:hypothetical protein O6H91_06G012500 [Diphasiastrum complanatum]
MLSNWSESLPEPVAEIPESSDAPTFAAGGVNRPPRASYVPPHLRNPHQSAFVAPEALQGREPAPRIIKTGHIPKGSSSSYDSFEPQGEARKGSALGALPRATQAGAGTRPWPPTDSSARAVNRRDSVAVDANSGRSGRNAISDRRGRRDREGDPFLKDETSEAMFSQENTGINFDAYEDIPVETSGDNVPPPANTFGEIDLGPALNANIQRCKYVKPTPVQKHAIPISLAGRDLMACAQTGSGKTAAFCFPIIAGLIHNSMRGRPRGGRKAFPLALILSPTRELSCQIHDEAKKFAYQTGIRVVVAYGGAPVHHQLRELERGVDILVATPGRLSDLLERARLSLSMVRYLALDEADRMLDMGFEPQIRRIVEQMDMPPVGERQTMLFSATFPKEIQVILESHFMIYDM